MNKTTTEELIMYSTFLSYYMKDKLVPGDISWIFKEVLKVGFIIVRRN